MGSLRSLRRRVISEDGFQQPSVNQPDPAQMGLDLISACIRESWREAALLLDVGADPNVVNPACPSSTILELALRWNATIDFIKLLLKKGADVSKTPGALLETCHHHQVGKTELLLRYGADPNVKDAHGRTPLMRSLWGNWDRFIRPLVKYRADVNATDNDGTTALMLAAEMNNSGAVTHLLKCGADPYIKDNNRKTAMKLGKKWWLVVSAFEEAGIKV